jgi:bleomycin hydrolase
MQKVLLIGFLGMSAFCASAQPSTKLLMDSGFTVIKSLPATPVKDQAITGTCWSFSGTSLLESQCLKSNLGEMDISEMFIVRNMYIEKAKNYVLRLGHAQFGEGGLGHDLIRGIATYGAMPESVYSGLKEGRRKLNHSTMVIALKKYLDSVVKQTPIRASWLNGYVNILNETMPEPPTEFEYKGKKHTPISFAKEVLKFNADDYVSITSFTHQPYYKPFILQVPDNFSNGMFYNLPLAEMIQLTKDVLGKGYTIAWDADVSNNWFMDSKGIALYPANKVKPDKINSPDFEEGPWDADIRQQLYESLETQDDHLMHITGLTKSKGGKTFFTVKNSWGAEVGPFNGYIGVSEAYFAINTISLVVPKAAIGKALLDKLKLP